MAYKEKIVVAIDGSDVSWEAFNYAVIIAKQIGDDKVTAIHSEIGGSKTKPEDMRSGREILEEAEQRGKDAGVDVTTHILVRGHEPAVDIVKFAEENSFDHIVLGHRGLTGLQRVLLGSVARGVVERAHCAVTVIRNVCSVE
jgi:nucleotide-binding universal stress UspA family protein